MNRSRPVLVVWAVITLLAYRNVHAADYEIVDLGTFAVIDIDDRGRMLSGSYLWENGLLTLLQGLQPSRSMSAKALNNKGQVVGSATLPNGVNHACLWQDGITTDLGSLGGNYSLAAGINEKGQVVGFSTTSNSYHPFLWQDGTMSDLGTLPGYDESRANAINERGQIVGDTMYGHAWLWQDGTFTDLGQGNSTVINNLGQIAGGFGTSGDAWIWENGVKTNLRTLEGVSGSSYAEDINDNGLVVGFSRPQSGPRSGWSRPWLWQNGKVTYLPTLRPWFDYGRAYAINSSGQIVGGFYGEDDKWHNVLWQPVPEPSSVLALLLGLGTVGCLVRRRRR